MAIQKPWFSTFLLICLLGIFTMSSQANVYNYSIEAESPPNYPMAFDFEGNYFFDAHNQLILNFTTPGGSDVYWGSGTQATLLSEYNPLPYGIHVRWFSLTENQFWEGSYIFDQRIIQKLPNYTVNNLLFREKTPFTRYFIFNVYVTTGGLVTVWVKSGGEQFLVGQFFANKMTQEPDWNLFYRRALSRTSRVIEPRDKYIEQMIKKSELFVKNTLKGKAERFNTQQTKKPYTAQPWLKTMKNYHWLLSLNNGFVLKDYLTWYVNGEKVFTYSGENQLATPRAVPYDFTFYFEDARNNQLKRIDMTFDADEIMELFQKVALTPPLDDPINLHIEIAPDYKQISIFVSKGKTKIELKKVLKAALNKLYNA